MFISHEEFNSIMNEAYLKGYEDGKIEGRREIMQTMLTPNDIRKIIGFPNIVEEEEEHLTCKQLLTEEHPEYIDPYLDCGCKGCPNFYGYISKDERLCNVEKIDFNIMPEGICTKCWNQVATKYYKDKKENK